MNFGRTEKNTSKENKDINTIQVNTKGLTTAQVSEMKAKYGSNTLTKKRKVSFCRQLLNNLNDPIIKILIGALVINAIITFGHINIPETIGIGAAIIISTLVSTISEYSSSLAFEKICISSENTVYSVRRNGDICSVHSEDIVVGDIILLSPGQKVPTDGIITSGEITCNQSSLTGESTEISKHYSSANHVILENEFQDTSNKTYLFSGSIICTGSCEMLTLYVGDNTLIGKLAEKLNENNRPSPLKKRLSELAKNISFLGYVAAIMIAFACLFNSFIIDSNMDLAIIISKFKDKSYLINQILHAVTVAVSVIVVAVPEGLPMMITVILSSNMKKMIKNGVLVRKLVGIETAGNLNILFTDKTGTLTCGNMMVTCISTYNQDFYSIKELKQKSSMYNKIFECVDSACSVGNTSSTERSIINFILNKSKRNSAHRIPFNSKDKYSYGILGTKNYYIGAPEILFKKINYILDDNGNKLEVDHIILNNLSDKLTCTTKNGSRVVCCIEKYQNEYTFLCLIVISDALRPNIKKAVKQAQSAGIQVMMVTGDNPETATSIAKEAGIINDKCNIILTSDELNKFSDDYLSENIFNIAVVARALPSDKLRLVHIAEKKGLVSGMTGDGINDSPALKAADVGFAMGSGTDIAKESSDIVITDDSFLSITNAVLYGRTIFESIRKFIVFQLTMNLCAMGVSLIGPFIGIDNPVTVIQMLWVNIIMDTLGGLAFAGEPALYEYMLQKSRSISEKILNNHMIFQIIITGGYTLALCIFFLKSPLIHSLFEGKSETYFLTAFFALIIFCGIFNSFNARSTKINMFSHISQNQAFILIMLSVGFIQLLIIYYGGSVFRCIPLDPNTLIITALIASTVIPADMIRKFISSVLNV